MAKFHSFGDIQATITESIEQASQANRQAVEGIANLVMKSSSSGGFLSDALYGARDACKSSIIDNAAKINPEQAKALFELIKPDALAAVVFADYFSVHFSLVRILIEEGRQIQPPPNDEIQIAQSIFQNLTNPNFPQDQITAAFIRILKANPYRKEYHQYMVNSFGENEETSLIRDYFGFSDLSDPWLS